MTLVCSVVNPFLLNAANKMDVFRDLIDLLLGEGGDAAIYVGPLAQDLDLPDPSSTRNIDAAPKWAIEESRQEEEVTDNWLHSCSVLLEKSSEGIEIPTKLLFQARLQSGRDSTTYHLKTDLEGRLEKAEVNHGKLDEEGKPIRGSAVNATAFLDIDSPEAKSRLKHELDLWLLGKYLKPKVRKKHLSDLAYYRNKRTPAPKKK